MATFGAVVGKAVFSIVSVDNGGVTVTLFTEDGGWPIFFLSGDFMGVISVAVQAVLDFIAILQGNLHSLVVHMGTIALCLIQKFRIDTNNGKGRFHINLVVASIGRIPVKRVGHHGNGESQAFCQLLGFRHVQGNLAEYIVVVPRIDKANILASITEGTNHQVYGNNFTEVTDVNST